MKRKLVITKIAEQVVTAVLENEEVVEIHVSDKDTEAYRVGNIYVGKVKNIVPNIQAAFIEIANGVECYYSIPQNPSPHFTQKVGKKPLCIGDELLVQIQKEAVKTKVPTVTSNLSFTGKYVVLTSGIKKIGISSKITGEKRAGTHTRHFLQYPQSHTQLCYTILNTFSLSCVPTIPSQIKTSYQM